MKQRHTTIKDPLGPIKLGWLEWGDPRSERTVLCVHGLTRNAHDFDKLTQRLAKSARILSLDVVGRGESSWLDDPTGYDVEHYARHIQSWLQQIGVMEVDWVGTSMGGLIAMMTSADNPNLFRSLVLKRHRPVRAKVSPNHDPRLSGPGFELCDS